MTTLPKCDRFKKVTVLTDPQNPEKELIDRATEHGEPVYIHQCEDGFVYLIKLPDQE
ncbi:MAG: hypothetical protein V4509_01825 [Patescibacteria group bacterium]